MRQKWMRPIWFVLGTLALGLGVLGVFLPVLPTTPLVLVAAFFFSRSSQRVDDWLLAHPRFGPVIAEWRATGAIAVRIKRIAVGTMAAVFVASLVVGLPGQVLVWQALGLGIAALFVLTRPSA